MGRPKKINPQKLRRPKVPCTGAATMTDEEFKAAMDRTRPTAIDRRGAGSMPSGTVLMPGRSDR